MITKKKILSLIALAIITVIVSVACSSPTDVENMAVTEAGPTPPPEFPEDNTDNKLSIDTNQGLIQFKDLYFKSGAYYSIYDTVKKIYFYADVRVDENSKPYLRVITIDENGVVVEDEGKFYDNANGTGAVYNLEATRYQSNNRNTATVTFTEDGYLIIKFSNYGADITYSLTDKSDGLIPEMWWGKYYDLSRAPIAIVTANSISLYGSDGGSFLYTVEVYDSKTTYLGNNTWHYYYDAHNNGNDSTIKFKLNENRQRVLLENPLGIEYTFVHEDDINK
ncbi:hypothetical protein [Brachyspira sp.]|uniref:hypothetical protein n=1 Tax=Brachyspira sp. TaxID=1977261 RepID=UPI003D7D18A7